MCGIAGIFHYGDPSQRVDLGVLQAMTRTLAHRGPDGEGTFIDDSVGLGNRRLAIVELSPAGHQPMTSVRGDFAITYNGESYNHQGFRNRLVSRGWVFRGESDTETILNLLVEYGPSALSDVEGIFSLAFWDRARRKLLLARDPLGVKQLYYHDDGKRIAFASEIKALLHCPGVKADLDPAALNEYLHFHTPLFSRTFFDGIGQLAPGEYLEVTANGPRPKIYWRIDGFEPRDETPAESVESLCDLLERVVRDQLMSDVPVGAFFSGGIDSSAIAAYAKRANKQPLCFGVHFTGQGVIDERPYQEAAAKALGVELQLITNDGGTFPEDLRRLMYFQDQPVIGPALVPMYYVSKLAARSVKVCLGGQAADEVFGGYARYALVNPARVMSNFFASRGEAQPSEAPRSQVGGNLLKQLLSVRNAKRALKLLGTIGGGTDRYFDNFAQVPERAWQQVFNHSVVSRRNARQMFDDGIARSSATDASDRVMHWDIQTYLPGLFQQDDRMSMANSLESRVPFADPRIVRHALHTRFDLKFRDGASKWILRQAVADVLPSHVLNRRKVGFDTPAEAWIRDRHSGFVKDLLLSSAARSRGWWNGKAIEAFLADDRQPFWFERAWKLVCVETWASIFIDGNTPPGVTNPTLEASRP